MKVGLSRAKSPDKFDFVLMAYLIVMAITSFVSIYSSFGIVGAQAGMGYLTKQIMWFMAGFIALGVIMYLGNDSMFQFANGLFDHLIFCQDIILTDRQSDFYHAANQWCYFMVFPSWNFLSAQ